jgi:hypothetical protein
MIHEQTPIKVLSGVARANTSVGVAPKLSYYWVPAKQLGGTTQRTTQTTQLSTRPEPLPEPWHELFVRHSRHTVREHIGEHGGQRGCPIA